jgi:hypothetical protein
MVRDLYTLVSVLEQLIELLAFMQASKWWGYF